MENLVELSDVEIYNTNGGSWLSDFVCEVIGEIFMTPGAQAINGVRADMIMPFK